MTWYGGHCGFPDWMADRATKDEPDEPDRICPATREAVWEQEMHGKIGCPICGSDAMFHDPEEEMAR